jgi:hypothetical protein
MNDLRAPMLSVTTILNEESSCCVKQGRCFMRKVHNLIDKFGQWGKKKGVSETWAANREKDIGNIPMEVVLRDNIGYDEL